VAIASQAAATAVGKKSLFFCQSRSVTESVAERMRGRGIDVFVHHSSVSLEERQAAEERFHHGNDACIVCTSTLELGIDVGDLDLVFQENAPSTVSSFLQRMGRTGRRPGAHANQTFFCETSDAVLQAAALVELAREHWVESTPEQTRCWPVLVHQLLAMTLQFGAIGADQCWDQLSRVLDFQGIAKDEFDELIQHMLKNDFLFESGGMLSMGDRAERVFGKKNFMELYAVFSTPLMYRVQTEAGRALGSLEQAYVDRLVEEMTSFLLGGRAWTVEHVNHGDRIVRVRPAPRGQKPSWGGYIPQHLSFEVSQRMQRILASEAEPFPYLDAGAANSLATARDDLGPLLRTNTYPIQMDDGRARWWTFAGGRINHTLKYGMEWLEGWKVVADNFQLRIEGDGVTHGTVQAAIENMSQPDFWGSKETRAAMLARVPDYRLSKFQVALPDVMAAEMVGAYLLDFDRTQRFLTPPGPEPTEDDDDG
jgi:ATP-dependent Lhr-like helicase